MAPEPDVYSFVFSADSTASKRSGWVLDSGATSSATYDADDCIDVVDCKVNVTAAGCTFVVVKKGKAIISAIGGNGKANTIQVRNCLISEKFPFKLLALQAFTKRGHTVFMQGNSMSIADPAKTVIMTADKDPVSKLYFLAEEKIEKNSSSLTFQSDQPEPPHFDVFLAKSYAATGEGDLLWKLHLRHGHRNFADVCRQYSIPVPKNIPACTSCVMGKAHLHPHLTSGFTRATRRAEGFHSDFRGPFSCPTPFGQIYLLTIIDDFSRRIFAFLVTSQTEWFDIWTKFVTRVEAELGKMNCISWLLSDNGGVYKSQLMLDYCASKGIQQRHSAPYSQFMDHTAERNMRTIGEMMTTTMLHANLPKRAWGFAALHAAEVINRTSESAASNKAANVRANFSRLERWKGTALPGQTKGLYPFGCLAFKHVPLALRTKLDAHAKPCVYLGIDANSKAFLLGTIYDLSTSVSVEVTFFENVFPFRKLKQEEAHSTFLWDPSPTLVPGDPKLGVYDAKPQFPDREAAQVMPPPPTVPDAPVIPEKPPITTVVSAPANRPADFWKQILDKNKPQAVIAEKPVPVISNLRRSARVI